MAAAGFQREKLKENVVATFVIDDKSLFVGRVEEDAYIRIKTSPVKNWELCPVPQNEDAVVTVDGRKAVLSYAIGTFSSSSPKL